VYKKREYFSWPGFYFLQKYADLESFQIVAGNAIFLNENLRTGRENIRCYSA
jgi:hypothetical protein